MFHRPCETELVSSLVSSCSAMCWDWDGTSKLSDAFSLPSVRLVALNNLSIGSALCHVLQSYVFGTSIRQWLDSVAFDFRCVMIVVVADAAAANIKFLRMFACYLKLCSLATVLFWSEKCGLHQSSRIVLGPLTDAKIVSALYGLSKLVRQRKIKKDIKAAVRNILASAKFHYRVAPDGHPACDANSPRFHDALRSHISK